MYPPKSSLGFFLSFRANVNSSKKKKDWTSAMKSILCKLPMIMLIKSVLIVSTSSHVEFSNIANYALLVTLHRTLQESVGLMGENGRQD